MSQKEVLVPNEPILMQKGDTLYLRSIEDRFHVHTRVALGDKAIHLDIDPMDRGEKHLIGLEDLYIRFLMERPLSVKKYIRNVQVIVFYITKVDMNENTVEIFLTDGIEAFNLDEPA